MEKLATLQYFKGIGPRRAALLAKLGIENEEELLSHYPRRYVDRSQTKPVVDLEPGQIETIMGTVLKVEELKPRKGLTIIKVLLSDGLALCQAVWFNQLYIKKQLTLGEKMLVTGKVSIHYGHPEIAVSEFEIVGPDESLSFGRIVPFYPSTEGLNQKFWRDIQRQVLQKTAPQLAEIMTPEQREDHQLCTLHEALQGIHFPTDFHHLEQARTRLVFEEFYLLQLALASLRINSRQEKSGIRHGFSNVLAERMLANMPFRLTRAQQRVIGEVKQDMESSIPMQRLVQGDVGSGKTVIAAWAILKAVEAGYQGVFMAPTEILAQQHYENMLQWLVPLGIKPALLTGALTFKEKERVLVALLSGEAQVIVGTHALIQEAVSFANIGLLVIDEQHRFGVKQRALLEAKGHHPDVLVMSATPIPRTLAMTVYGDLDVSVVDELPPGRKSIETICLAEKARAKVHHFIGQQLDKGAQVFIVCPLVEESEALDIKNATQHYETFQKAFGSCKVGLLHGRMSGKEKEALMESFHKGVLQILVTTTVIEVGVNVPNATVMVIEDAERFGLAQLHQLRGRVGRGDKQSYCLLVTGTQNPLALERLKLFTEIQDGFKLAEEDLKLRGPGEFFGMRQHGLPEFKLADISRDSMIMSQARNLALKILKEDPEIKKQENQVLAEQIKRLIKKMVKN